MAGTHSHPAALLRGETGPLLIAFRLAPDSVLADDLHALIRANVANRTDDVMWGAPGTLVAALALLKWTGEPRWKEAARESAAALRARRGEDWLWRQDDDYRGLGTVHGAAGNTLVLLRLEPDEVLAAETGAVLTRTAFREGGLANWPGSPRPQLAGNDGRIRLQWCTGAPGVVAGAWEYLDEELLLAGAALIWRAGAHGDEKGHGICHGTSGNGFVFPQGVRAHRRRALARARAPLRRPRARPGRAPLRCDRPWPLLALDGRPRHRPVCGGLPRPRHALPDPGHRVGQHPTMVSASSALPARGAASDLSRH